MDFLQNTKQYTSKELERTFFLPMLTGASAEELGIRIVYNMPIPTDVLYYSPRTNILKKYNAQEDWKSVGGSLKNAVRIPMANVKAESCYSASDYFSTIYENLMLKPGIDMENLTGTALEEIETSIFRQEIQENLRATMWVGDTSLSTGLNTFDGFIKQIFEISNLGDISTTTFTAADAKDPNKITTIFDKLWELSNPAIHSTKRKDRLAYFVTSDLYELYEKYLDAKGVDSAFEGMVNGHKTLSYHGIAVINLDIEDYQLPTGVAQSFAFLTSRDNLVLAVNTADMPGNEVRMWYNPDAMENRQRACFMAGCSPLDTTLITVASLA